jgi:hypothetical protein
LFVVLFGCCCCTLLPLLLLPLLSPLPLFNSCDAK